MSIIWIKITNVQIIHVLRTQTMLRTINQHRAQNAFRIELQSLDRSAMQYAHRRPSNVWPIRHTKILAQKHTNTHNWPRVLRWILTISLVRTTLFIEIRQIIIYQRCNWMSNVKMASNPSYRILFAKDKHIDYDKTHSLLQNVSRTEKYYMCRAFYTKPPLGNEIHEKHCYSIGSKMCQWSMERNLAQVTKWRKSIKCTGKKSSQV